MKDIKRYGTGLSGQVIETKQGSFVDYDDHAAILAAKDARISELVSREQWQSQRTASFDILNRKYIELQEQVRALAAEANYLRNEIKQHSTSVHFCEVCGKDDPCKTDDVCFSLNHPLPATDAALREIRALAVDAASDELKDLATRSKGASSEHIHAAALYLMTLSASIRAGERP